MFNNLCKDLRIIELASVLAGPSVGAFFAEFGAEIIKVENISSQGDVTRSWKTVHEKSESDISSYFSSVNFGKKSIGINLSSKEGKQLLYILVKSADIVITSYKKNDDIKFGVSYTELQSINKSIIYGQITGYGTESDRTGYDAIIQAETGHMDINGEKDSEPCKLPVALMDVLAGHQLKEAILFALWNREKTGNGSYIPISLYDSAISGLVNQSANFLNTDISPKSMGSDHPNIVPYGTVFNCLNKQKVILAIGSNKQFNELLDILNISEMYENYSTNILRVQKRDELNDLLQLHISKFDQSDLLDLLHSKKIPAGSVNNMKTALSSNEAQKMIIKSENHKATKHSTFSDVQSLSSPPHFGEHTKEVLLDLNFTENDITSLISKGIVS